MTIIVRKPCIILDVAGSYFHYYRMVQMRQSNQRPFDETMCDASVTNGDLIKPSKKMQNVCDGGDIKHGSY